MITGHGGLVADPAAQADPVQARHHDVQQGDVGAVGAERLQAGQPVGRGGDQEAVALQGELGGLADDVVVLDEEHMGFGHSFGSAFRFVVLAAVLRGGAGGGLVRGAAFAVVGVLVPDHGECPLARHPTVGDHIFARGAAAVSPEAYESLVTLRSPLTTSA